MKPILHILKSIGPALALFGFFWLPKDIEDRGEAAVVWWKWFAMIDQNTALWVFSILMAVYITWVNVRPSILTWWKSKFSPSPVENNTILIDNQIHVETFRIVTEPKDERIYENVFYIAVGNTSPIGKTLRNVQARLFHHIFTSVLTIKNRPAGLIDIRHGESGMFEVGRISTVEPIAAPVGTFERDDDISKVDFQNTINKNPSFKIASLDDDTKRSLGLSRGTPHVWELIVVVSSDDVLGKTVKVSVDLTSTKTPVSLDVDI